MPAVEFPKVTKREPIYVSAAGNLYERVLQGNAIDDPACERAECDGRVIWLKAIAGHATKENEA